MRSLSKILIIEDEPLIARNLEMILSARNYNVAELIYTKADAIKAISTSAVDLVLLDLNLEGHFEGLEIAEQLHNNYEVPFIFITSYASTEILDKAKVYCPLGYIVKPFDADEIYANVEIALYTYSQKSTGIMSLEMINSLVENPINAKEYQVLIELTKGNKYKDIADDLFISINTLTTHIKSIFSKFYIHSRSEIAPFLRKLK